MLLLREVAQRQARLVADDDQAISAAVKQRQSFDRSGQQANPIDAGVVWYVLDQRAILVEKDGRCSLPCYAFAVHRTPLARTKTFYVGQVVGRSNCRFAL